jgi:hypothetical protein
MADGDASRHEPDRPLGDVDAGRRRSEASYWTMPTPSSVKVPSTSFDPVNGHRCRRGHRHGGLSGGRAGHSSGVTGSSVPPTAW